MNAVHLAVSHADVLAAVLGVTTGFLAALLGFQINLVALQYGIHYRKRETFRTGVGAAIADILIFLLAFAGISQIDIYPGGGLWLKAAAALVLVMLALRLFFIKAVSDKEKKAAAKARSRPRSFLMGFLLVVGNPGMFALWFAVAGFLSLHFPGFQSHRFLVVFFGGFAAGTLAWFGLLTHIVVRNMKLIQPRKLLLLSRGGAVLLLLCAAAVFFTA